MNAQEIVERIMSAHWDIRTCPCWVCEAGRSLGFAPRDGYLLHKDNNREMYPPLLIETQVVSNASNTAEESE